MTLRHFTDLSYFDGETLKSLLKAAAQLKKQRQNKRNKPLLAGKTLAMIFEKNSTRTRVSFEIAMVELGGHALMMNGNDLQLGRGETIGDTARVLSRYVDAIMLRCHSHEKLLELAAHSHVPVINGLTEFSHPCQIMADLMTYEERRGSIRGKTVAWIGDGNNVAQSWIQAAALFGCTLRIACPPKLAPLPEVVDWSKARGGIVEITDQPEKAVAGADCVITDAWVSMGDPEAEAQMALLAGYHVDEALMKKAAKDAIFMHCLPAHRGQEVTPGVIDGPQSVVFDEAENRLHAQKAILLWCLGEI
jgi:ornithine carbamoyltransferase